MSHTLPSVPLPLSRGGVGQGTVTADVHAGTVAGGAAGDDTVSDVATDVHTTAAALEALPVTVLLPLLVRLPPILTPLPSSTVTVHRGS
ncbi:hypothetical protein O5169_27825 [Escherichia coli]|nr:hypothetical protein [Escherichia coli]